MDVGRSDGSGAWLAQVKGGVEGTGDRLLLQSKYGLMIECLEEGEAIEEIS